MCLPDYGLSENDAFMWMQFGSAFGKQPLDSLPQRASLKPDAVA
jgi:hypothetical protein